MDATTKNKLVTLVTLIKARPEYKDTPIEGDDTLNYHAFNAFGTTIVLENYDGSRENNREFLIFTSTKTEDRLRPVTEIEDEILRAWDDEYPMLERDDVEFICAKPKDEGTVKR